MEIIKDLEIICCSTDAMNRPEVSSGSEEAQGVPGGGGGEASGRGLDMWAQH